MNRLEKHSTFNIQRSMPNEHGVTTAAKRAGESPIVAQICNLPYRRVALGKASNSSGDFENFNGLRIANPRYSRM